jgi:RimJ/RimL family protein N-acetyltransferase
MTAWTTPPTLTDADVTLRPMVDADRDAVLAAASDGELWNLFFTNVPGPETIDRYMAVARNDRGSGRSMPFVVEFDGAVVGATRFMRMNPTHRRLEIGTTFYATSVQRTSVNTTAKRLLLHHAFEVMDVQCVQLRTDRLNHRSRRAIERLGAQLDGVLRSHTVMPDGRVRDTAAYSITRGDWPGVRANLDHLLADR